MMVGDTAQLTVAAVPWNAKFNASGVKWQSSNTDALTVDGNGFVTAVGEGKACKPEKTSSFRLILNEKAGRRQDFLPPFSMRSTLIDCILK